MAIDLSFSAIAKNVGEIASAFADGFSPDVSVARRYPILKNVTNFPNFTNRSWQESLGYEFQVVHADDPHANALTTNTGQDWDKFRLQINPQELTQDEIFAIEVTPTFRGVLVEHHGVTLKDITISGTTGNSPNRGVGGADADTGRPRAASGHSGHEEFNELRSYIRTYVEAKRLESPFDDGSSNELRLVWRNLRDNEALFVEPQKFTMKRSATKPLMYDYNIQMKAIGIVAPPKGRQSAEDDFNLFDFINKAAELIENAIAFINASVDLVRQVARAVTDLIIGPLRAISAALAALKAGKDFVLGVTKRFLRQLDNEIKTIENNFNDLIGRDLTTYNTAANRVPTTGPAAVAAASGARNARAAVLAAGGSEDAANAAAAQASSDAVANTPPISRESTYEELKVLNGFNQAKRGISMLLSRNELFIQSIDRVSAQTAEAYANSGQTFIAANSTRNVEIDGNDDIQTIAARHLGNPDRFKDIVLLNNLKPPYIDPAGGPGVLKPGDKILIPQTRQNTGTGVVKNDIYNISRLFSEAEKNMGVDIRLDENNDLAVSNTGDLDLIGGMDNISQALLLKLFYNKGSLKRHRNIGTTLEIGRKVRSSQAEDLRASIVDSFSSDLRVESIPFVAVSQEGGTTRMNILVKLKEFDQPVPLPLTV